MSCCDSSDENQPWFKRFDWLLWGSLCIVAGFYALSYLNLGDNLATFASSVKDLMNAMWWGLLLGILFVGLIGRIPREFIMSILGKGGSMTGIVRATLAGVLLDLCSHGILMVGTKLYERGASIGQVMAFLIASPWNSLSLTFILIGLIGLPWTLAFLGLSLVIGIITGLLFELCTKRGILPANPHSEDLPEAFAFLPEAKRQFSDAEINLPWVGHTLWQGLKDARMVIRWMLFGVILASLIRTFVPLEQFQQFFGPSLAGLGLTIIAATIIEVCSEGSTPIAADLLTRAKAPGNSFTFLMTGVSTDYTEIMVLRDTTKTWKIPLFLPLLTVPQVVVIGWLLNQGGAL